MYFGLMTEITLLGPVVSTTSVNLAQNMCQPLWVFKIKYKRREVESQHWQNDI